ncbi:TetR/AcrR family transcriptional regulator [Actinoplanes couchii]|uniref:TetR family transcriptional regulator n=1 Tax=Actinoplanes couchii TaxID=403638 RepID=A0ABQ3XK70_9ACTN|nr:TetR/AcrR family transcriptional regulator [Actinoplanes couchii]MDR6320494.1 AcrR family transcriptional regulator [Actinoplanes couchii]GID58898.1 TetR family transcriptional regulator [Actinoplanes couchii]
MTEAARADGRRNHQTLLDTAREAFAEHGTDVSLREVARRAGVGIGTLYRHFPTREALLEALMGQNFDRLTAYAEELLIHPSPGVALRTWLIAMAEGSTSYRGLPGSVLAALHDDRSQLHASCAAMRAGASGLLDRARQAGEIRSDVTTDELLALTSGAAWAAQQSPDHQVTRMVTLTLNGLSPRD